jgi:LytS/YehU family sensor histidine kinase
MSSSGLSESMLGGYLALFGATEVFIFVFMEIVTKLETIQRVIFKKAQLRDYAAFVILFGLFSIFGTLIGIQGTHGDIANIRDLAPMVAGLVAGPYVGLAVGLIGGIHRLSLGGVFLYCLFPGNGPCGAACRCGVPSQQGKTAGDHPLHGICRWH